MSSAMGAKEFLDFQQTIRDLERQVDILLREAATNGPSQRTRELTEKVYILAERAKQIRLIDSRSQSTTNQSILEKLPKQFDQDFGKFKGLITFVEYVRKQHYNATGHNLGRTYGSFGSSQIVACGVVMLLPHIFDESYQSFEFAKVLIELFGEFL